MQIPNYRFVEPASPRNGRILSRESALRPGELIEKSESVGPEGLLVIVRTREELDSVLRMLVPPGTRRFPSSFAPASDLVVTYHENGDPFGKVPFRDKFTGDPARLPEGSYLRVSRAPRVLNPKRPGTLWKTELGQEGELPAGVDARRTLTADTVNEPGLQFEPTVVNGMAVMQWNPKENQWVNQIIPDGELAEAPWTTERHYKRGGAITGIRAWKLPDGGVYVFRADEHAARFHKDLQRLKYPGTSPEMFHHAMGKLLEANREWVPRLESGSSAYVRFYGFNSTAGIRIKGGHWEVHGLVTPVGPYMPSQLNAVYTGMDRPVPRGFGDIKSGLCYPGPALELGRYAGATPPYHEAIFGQDTIQEGLSSGVAAVFYGAGAGGRDLVHFADGAEVLPSIMHRSAEEWIKAYPEQFETRRGALPSHELARANEVVALGTAALAAEITRLDGPGRFNEEGGLEAQGEVLFDRGRKPGELGRVSHFIRTGFESMIARDESLPAPFNTWMQKMA